MKIAYITNFCPHYRVKTFETFARYYDVDYYFFSAGDEWYWQQQHGTRAGQFYYEYLPGFNVGTTRISPMLPMKLLNKKYDVYMKCINGRFALPITYLIARLRRKPFILLTEIWMRLQTPFHRLAWPFTRYIYQHADAVVAYGEHVKTYLISEGVQTEKIFIAPQAIDNDFYSRSVSEEEKITLLQELGISKSKKIILYLGRLVKEKGLPYLIEAFASLSRNDAVLLIVGAGPEKEILERIVSEKGISDRVYFKGYVKPEQTVPYYSIAWVYAFPSITTINCRETWGLVVNEAFNQGVPVVASNSVGAAAGRLVRDGITGFIVPERDPAALARALQRILDDESLREYMSQNAKRIIIDWNNERMVNAFRQAIEYVQHK